MYAEIHNCNYIDNEPNLTDSYLRIDWIFIITEKRGNNAIYRLTDY